MATDIPHPTSPIRRRLVVDLNAASKSWALPASGEARIRQAAPPDWEVVIPRTPTTSDGDGGRTPLPAMLDAIRDAEIYFGFGMPRALFQAAKKLRWVQSASAGVASLLYPEMMASDVRITNAAVIMGDPIAEQALAGIFFLVRNLDIAVDQQRRAEWNKTPFVDDPARSGELSERRALIVGTGGIGSALARRLSALGCPCVGVRRRTSQPVPPGFEKVCSLDEIDAELPLADVIVLTTPLTPLTRHVLSAERIDCLKAGAIVVNVARGALLDQAALIGSLSSGRIRGAVLDVFDEEPLPVTSPLWGMRNVVITPHVAAVSPRLFWERALELFLDNWERYRAGTPLRNQVDKHAGY